MFKTPSKFFDLIAGDSLSGTTPSAIEEPPYVEPPVDLPQPSSIVRRLRDIAITCLILTTLLSPGLLCPDVTMVVVWTKSSIHIKLGVLAAMCFLLFIVLASLASFIEKTGEKKSYKKRS